MTNKKFNFNLSYSAYSLFKESPLRFYFQYIKKAKATNKTLQVYGDAGNVVHNALEDYINGKGNTFEHHWTVLDIDNQTGFRGRKLSSTEYLQMYMNGRDVVDNIEEPKIAELAIQKEFHGINCKGYIDMYVQGSSSYIFDWKTNSKHSREMHKQQRLFYTWLIWKCKGDIPMATWIYLRQNKPYGDSFMLEDVERFDKEIQDFLKTLEEWGDDINKYPEGTWTGPFNQHKDLCEQEVARRLIGRQKEIILNIKGNFVFLEGDVDFKLCEGIDYRTKFDLPDKYYMQEHVRKNKGGFLNIADIGTVHLFNRKFKCFPIGLLEKVHKICREYVEYYKLNVYIDVHDSRDQEIMNQCILMPGKLNTNKKLREYQLSAIREFGKINTGIINIPTGGGKTFVAAEIIKRKQAKTLWIIDRRELLQQTKKELETLLGIKVGTIQGGKIDIKDVTIATVQTLNTKLTELTPYLSTVNFVCVDEFHKAAAETYQKVFAKLPNTRYRLGLTATPYRDDGKDPILRSILGDVIYKITTGELIEQGYLIKPTIDFISMPNCFFDETYQEDYQDNIVFNEIRNHKMLEIWSENKDKKILILTKQVNHGVWLEEQLISAKHIHGKTKKKDREEILQNFRDGEISVLIGTLSIFAEGLDIPDLDVIINASANAGDVKSIQVLGRVLRTFKNKKIARYIDFDDGGKHTSKHSKARMKVFEEQGHKINIIK